MFICKLAVVLIFALLIVVILEKMQKTTVIGGQPPPRALGHVQTSPGDHDTSFWRYWRHL